MGKDLSLKKMENYSDEIGLEYNLRIGTCQQRLYIIWAHVK